MLNCFKDLWVYILVQMYQNQTRKFIYNFLPQNVLIPPNYILSIHFYNSWINIEFISFFSSSDMDWSLHLLGCHTTDINFSLFFKFFALFKFNMPSQKSDMNNSIRIVFIKIIINLSIIKIYINNTHFITRKYDITRIFTKVEYIFICVQSSKNFLKIL